MRHTASRLAPIALVVFACACARVQPGGFRIDVNDDLTKVSIESRGAPLANILAELRTKYSIDIRLDQDVNPPVDVSVSGVPLEDAVTRLVPQGTRYIVRTGAREWPVSGLKTGIKSGAAAVAGAGTLRKDSPRPAPTGTVVKRAVDVAPTPAVGTGPRFKGNPSAMLEVPAGRGPKRAAAAAAQSPVRSLRLRLTMTDTGTIRVDSAIIVDGAPPTAKPVVGPYLYGVRRADGSLLDFGSFADPLIEHSFRQEDQRHDERRAREGSFAISIPGVTREGIAALSLQVFDARNVTLPAALTQPVFDELSRRATAMRAVTGQEIARAAQGRRQ